VLIRPLSTNQHFRLHLHDGVRDFSSLEESIAYAQQVVPARLSTLARQAGADQVEVQMTRVDQETPAKGGWGECIYLGTQLTFTTAGRPRPARRA